MNIKKNLLCLLVVGMLLISGLTPATPAQAVFGDRITVSGSQFMAGGQRIWMNGANTPWNNWDDFGGNYNASWWDAHFQQLHDNGINSSRVWMTGDGEVGINIDANGFVSGATAAHWTHLDSLFSIAQSRQIYIMATFLSFDVTKNTHPGYTRWRAMFNSDANIDSYVANYVVPFVNRYKNNPWLWSIDLINEPDWIIENQEAGQLPWARVQQLAAKTARAVHANSPILFSVGMAMPKYQSPTISGDVMSDTALRGFVNDPLVFLDFRQTHYYDWMNANWGNTLYKTPADHGFITTRPWVIGENPAVGTSGHTITQDYESAFTMGWQGVMAWTSNGVDSNGSLTQLGPATTAFRNNHPALVFPSSGGPTATRTNTSIVPTFTRTPTRTNTPIGPTFTPTRTPTRTATPRNGPDLWVTSVVTSPNGWTGGCANNLTMGIRVTIINSGEFTTNAGPFVVDVSGTQQTVSGLAAGASVNLWFQRTGSLLITVDITNLVSEINESNNTFSYASITATPPVLCTRTPTPTLTVVGPTLTPTRTLTPSVGACSPVTATITAPFTFDGAGTFCWQSSNLGSFINNWNMASLTINGVNFTNLYVPVSAYPAKINGFWYVSYTGNFPWSHFEAK